MERYSSSEIISLAQSVIFRESAALEYLKGQFSQDFVDATTKILTCSGHVLLTGAGTSNSTASRFAHLLSCCGTPALFIHPGDSQHGLAGAVTSQDILLAISKGGETTEVNSLAKFAKLRSATLISITSNRNSTLARLSDIVLKVRILSDSDPLGIIATGSSLTISAYCDAFCEVLLKIRGYTKEKVIEMHPGGAVGQKYYPRSLKYNNNRDNS
jgi:D-arabinose 5-phosphate isomerase GutQ